jgi:release factor glutamine methyltransferase
LMSNKENNGNSEFVQAGSSLNIREALVEASSFLAQQGVDDADTDAQLLMQHMLSCDRSQLLLEWHEPFPIARSTEWRKLLHRRGQGEPVQYIVGEQEFYGLAFEVNSAVLIPRPETELLVEAIMKRWRAIWRNSVGGEQAEGPAYRNRPVVVDIGTGSGAIAVSLAAFNPGWQVIACDLSPRAIEVAIRNVERHGLAGRVALYQGNLLEPAIERGLHIDILVSNPPYIPSSDIPGLQREVREYEPMMALDGGDDGLYCYRRIWEQIERLPAVPRLVGFEVGFGQAREVSSMMERRGWWERIEIVEDYAGMERHVLGYHL